MGKFVNFQICLVENYSWTFLKNIAENNFVGKRKKTANNIKNLNHLAKAIYAWAETIILNISIIDHPGMGQKQLHGTLLNSKDQVILLRWGLFTVFVCMSFDFFDWLENICLSGALAWNSFWILSQSLGYLKFVGLRCFSVKPESRHVIFFLKKELKNNVMAKTLKSYFPPFS